MATKPVPVVRRKKIKDCEVCAHRGGDFFSDLEDPNVIRVYCKARHANVNAELMSNNCDFWQFNPELENPEVAKNKFGL